MVLDKVQRTHVMYQTINRTIFWLTGAAQSAVCLTVAPHMTRARFETLIFTQTFIYHWMSGAAGAHTPHTEQTHQQVWQIYHPNWVRLALNGTNLGLFTGTF